MRARNVELVNSDGSHRRWVCLAEAERLMLQGEVLRISSRKAARAVYRYKPVQSPSDSRNSLPCLTRRDMEVFAGLRKVDDVGLERLIGFKILPDGTPMPASGYL